MFFKKYIPRSLFGRSLMILILPVLGLLLWLFFGPK